MMQIDGFIVRRTGDANERAIETLGEQPRLAFSDA